MQLCTWYAVQYSIYLSLIRGLSNQFVKLRFVAKKDSHFLQHFLFVAQIKWPFVSPGFKALPNNVSRLLRYNFSLWFCYPKQIFLARIIQAFFSIENSHRGLNIDTSMNQGAIHISNSSKWWSCELCSWMSTLFSLNAIRYLLDRSNWFIYFTTDDEWCEFAQINAPSLSLFVH